MNSLSQFHQNHGAELEEIEGITIPIRYVNRFQEERQTLIHGAGILDCSSMMLIQVKGKDALQFLQGMVTNDLNALKIGGFQPNLICSNRGKIEHRVEIIRSSDNTLILCCNPGEGLDIGRKLDQYHIREELEMSVLNSKMIRVDLVGPLSGEKLENLGWPQSTHGWMLDDLEVITVEAPIFEFPRYINLVPVEGAVGFMERLKDEADSDLVGHEAFSDLLTYLGYPQFDVDYGKGNFPQEASLGDHISFNKGCYVGQEPHARMYHRGHPNWILVRLTFPKDVDVKPGTELYAEGESAGTLTSLSSIHDEEVKKGIGMIRHQLSLSGTVLNLKEDSTILIRQEALTYQI